MSIRFPVLGDVVLNSSTGFSTKIGFAMRLLSRVQKIKTSFSVAISQTLLSSLVFSLAFSFVPLSSFAQTHAPRKHMDPRALYARLSPAEKAEAETKAVEYLVGVFEKAIPQIKTPRQFVDVFLSDRSKSERAYILKHLKAIPIVYRTGPTSLGFDDFHVRFVIDFKNAARGEVAINGERTLIHPERSLQTELPILMKRLDYQLKNQGHDRYGLLDWFMKIIEPSSRAGRVSQGLKGMRALEKLAEQAAKKSVETEASNTQKLLNLQKKVEELEAKAAAAEKNSDWSLVKKGAATVGVLTGYKAVDKVGDLIFDYVKSKACINSDVQSGECANTRFLLQRDEMSSTSPTLSGGAADNIAKRAAAAFESSDVQCRKKIPEDLTRAQLKLKSSDITVNVGVKYNADGKVEASEVTDSKNHDVEIAKFTWVEGKLKEVCVHKSKSELAEETEKYKADVAKEKSSTLPGPDRCSTDKSTDDLKAEFELYSLMFSKMDIINVECAAKNAKPLEQKDAKVPDKVPKAGSAGGVQ